MIKMRKGLLILIIVLCLAVGYPNSLGSSKIFPNGMSVNVEKWKFTDSFYADYWVSPNLYQKIATIPPEGAKFLWVYIIVENKGDLPKNIPRYNGVELLYKGEILDPSDPSDKIYCEWNNGKTIDVYGGYGYLYDSDGEEIYPGVKREDWVYYEVPQNFHPEDTRIVIWGEEWGLSQM
jgi:hypothetical protein